MTQNTGEHANTNDIPGLTQTPEAQRQTARIASIINQKPTLGAVIDYYGRCMGVLAWFVNNPTGDMFAHIDNGTITTDPSAKGKAIIRIQDQNTGRIHTYTFPDIATAFWTLRLRTERCNGIDGWRELAAMPGIAGRD